MVDYYSILLRAVTAPGAGDAHWRRGIYDRSRQMLSTRMRSLEPPAALADIATEEARLEAAIERIESELSWTEAPAKQRPPKPQGPQRARTPGRLPSLQESLKPESLKPGTIEPSSRSRAKPTSKPASKPAWTNSATAVPADIQGSDNPDDYFATGTETASSPLRMVWIALAIVVAALGAGGYIFISGKGQKSAPMLQAKSPSAASTSAANASAPNSSAPNAAAAKTAASAAAASAAAASGTTASGAGAPKLAAINTGKNGELAPGIDGGSSDPDLQYVFRRQPTFYRTLQPVGTVIVDKGQHFLYLIQPNNVALRYGIAVGDQCANLAGMRHIASMAEWPTWQPPPEMLARNPSPIPGGPGNPLGARLLQLDDGNSRINGTNAPKTIGNPVNFGCIRLNNDDITDLYGRVKLTTPVVVN